MLIVYLSYMVIYEWFITIYVDYTYMSLSSIMFG